MLNRLKASWKKFRKERDDYELQRALYKQGGGAGPPSRDASGSTLAPPTASHDTDPSKLAGGE